MKMRFSINRFLAMMVKEFLQIRRDRVTLGMLVMIPLIQLLLFGYAININPKHLPTVVVSPDHSVFTRDFTSALQNTKYFRIIEDNASPEQAKNMIATGRAQFAVTIPANFTRKLVRGERPQILVTADASDPSSTGNAIAALQQLPFTVFNHSLEGVLHALKAKAPPFDLVVHAKYNPEKNTQFNVVPGLMGVILTMTLVMVTGLVVTKEYERGTMESLLATPVKPLEVMLGKIAPYIIVGYVQEVLILLAAKFLFAVPVAGSITLLIVATLPFIAANLALGLTFSTLAQNQLQAVQMTFFFFLPSILLSGFMFPFYGMPLWAQWFGECLPLTHFLRIVRGIMLKGNDFAMIWPDIWPILIFMVVAMVLCVARYRQTLD